MSAIGTVTMAEGVLNALATHIAANGRNQAQACSDSPRTINAVRQLVGHLKSTQAELQRERAARAALEDQVEVLRTALENAAAQIMRMKDDN